MHKRTPHYRKHCFKNNERRQDVVVNVTYSTYHLEHELFITISLCDMPRKKKGRKRRESKCTSVRMAMVPVTTNKYTAHGHRVHTHFKSQRLAMNTFFGSAIYLSLSLSPLSPCFRPYVLWALWHFFYAQRKLNLKYCWRVVYASHHEWLFILYVVYKNGIAFTIFPSSHFLFHTCKFNFFPFNFVGIFAVLTSRSP